MKITSIYLQNFRKLYQCHIDFSEDDIHCLYYKREEYREQNEFRIALPQLRIDRPAIYQIGSLSKVAYCVPLMHLKHGVIMAENEENFQLLKQRCEALGYGVGDGFDFDKSKEV